MDTSEKKTISAPLHSIEFSGSASSKDITPVEISKDMSIEEVDKYWESDFSSDSN